jgi:hypothetical protein
LARSVRERAGYACEYCWMPQAWDRHFRWDGADLIGRTAVGRTTIAVLAMNDPDVIKVRRSLIEAGLFPPVH